MSFENRQVQPRRTGPRTPVPPYSTGYGLRTLPRQAKVTSFAPVPVAREVTGTTFSRAHSSQVNARGGELRSLGCRARRKTRAGGTMMQVLTSIREQREV